MLIELLVAVAILALAWGFLPSIVALVITIFVLLFMVGAVRGHRV